MFKRISTFVVGLAACAVTIAGLAAPAMARTSETVELTFRLEVEGDVPGWQHFAVEYYPAGGQPGTLPLCTTDADKGPAGPRCEGGHIYTARAEVPAGSTVTYRFLRHDTRTAPEYFQSASEAFALDRSVNASYVFPSGAPGAVLSEPSDDGAAHDQYDDDGAIPSASDDLFPEMETTVEDEIESGDDDVTASGVPATSPASASVASGGSPITVLPNTGGAGAALMLGLALVALGGGFAFRKEL